MEWQPQYGNIEAMLVQICAFIGARCVRGVRMARARPVHSVCMARVWRACGPWHVHLLRMCDLCPGLWSRAVRGSRHSSRPQPGPPSPRRRQAPRRPRLSWSRRLRRRPTRSSAAFTRKGDGLQRTRMGDGAAADCAAVQLRVCRVFVLNTVVNAR